MSPPSTLRLDRLLGNLGYGSRREIANMAARGRVRLDGAALRDAELRLPLNADTAARLTIDGEPVDPLPGVLLMLHKPVGVTCSHKEAGPLVFRLLPERWQRRDPAISAIGRLDKDTSGLLLLTDDGAFLHQIISPRRHIPKRYAATLDRPLRGDEAAVFASGELTLESEKTPLLPAALEIVDEREVVVTLTEGRYHQVRRMFAAVGNHVVALRRLSVGGLTLPDDLKPGEFAVLGESGRTAALNGGEGHSPHN